jgi:transcriptional regulator with XRE-family HTH domain
MDFWMRLKNEIKAKNTTQEWIAGKIGVPLSTFRKWMTRKTYPDMREGVEIARLLDTSAEYLVTGCDSLALSRMAELSEEEKNLMSGYRKLNKADQENIILALNAWLGKSKSA